MSSKFKRPLVLGTSVLALALSVAPASYAGEDDGDDETTTTEQPAPAPIQEESSSESESSSSSSSSGDTQVAVGGVQTGAGGMASATDLSVLVPLGVGGALIALTATAGVGGLALRRR
jgi:hypothetical protein